MIVDILARIDAEVLRESIGDGPVWRVQATTPPRSAVLVGREELTLQPAHHLYGRIDVICIQVDPLELVVLHGVPSWCPTPPVVPVRYDGSTLLPLAYIHRHACGSAVLDCHVVPIPGEAR